jgi:transcriptional regulator with XRE-family HTH domain
MDIQVKIGSRIKELRNEKNLTQEAVVIMQRLTEHF